jgi:hypothetical protein
MLPSSKFSFSLPPVSGAPELQGMSTAAVVNGKGGGAGIAPPSASKCSSACPVP